MVLMKDSLFEWRRPSTSARRWYATSTRTCVLGLLFHNVPRHPAAAGALFPAFGIRPRPDDRLRRHEPEPVCVVLNALRLRLFKDKNNTARIAAAPDPAAEEIQHTGQTCRNARKDKMK